MIKRLVGCLLLLMMLAPGVCAAQEVISGKWWRMPEVADPLKLTDAQKKKLDDLYMANRDRLGDLKSEMAREQGVLEDMLEKEPLTDAEVTAQMRKLDEVRSNLAAERFSFVLQVRKLLGLEGFRQLKILLKDTRGRTSVIWPNKNWFCKRYGFIVPFCG